MSLFYLPCFQELDMSHIKVEVASDSDEPAIPSDSSAEEESKGVSTDAVKAVKSEQETRERSPEKVSELIVSIETDIFAWTFLSQVLFCIYFCLDAENRAASSSEDS